MSDQRFAYLKRIAEKTVCDCTFPKDFLWEGKSEKIDLLLPSGDEKYQSFWVRDCVMMAESGLVPLELMRKYIEIFAACGQNGEMPRFLQNGLVIPPFAVADHINYNGKAVYYPGTYNDGENQGEGRYGFFPPSCDSFYFILMVGAYLRFGGDASVLDRFFSGFDLKTRLEKAFSAYGIDESTQLCTSDEKYYTVDFGFTDSIQKSGHLLFASILRYRAACALEEIFADDPEKKNMYRQYKNTIAQSIRAVFYDESSGWLYSATGIGHQHDVWGTAYAAYLGIVTEEKTLSALKAAYLDKTAFADGQVRHILTTENAREDSAWEVSRGALDTYQNGGYWATATGWYAGALYRYDKTVSLAIFDDFIAHTEKYADAGAPFEWINRDTSDFSGCKYGTSGVLPYIAYTEKCLG